MKGTLERFVEFAAKDSAEHLDGKKEIVAWFDPVRAIGGQPTGRHHAVYMRVKFEFLSPAVQHAEEADFSTEMLGIASDFQKSFRTGAKQEIVDDLLVLQDQRGQMTRKREDHMDVARREKLLLTRCEPAIASSCLTLRAVAGPSTRPVVICFAASMSPVDSLSRSGGVQKHGGRWWFVPGRYGLTASGCYVDPHLPRVDVWRSSASACVGAPVFGGPLAGRLLCKRTRPPWYRSAYHRYASGCLERAMRWAFALTDASAHAVP